LRQHHHAFAARVFRSGDAHAVVEIERTVAADRAERMHRADHHHRLVGLHPQVEKVSGLFERGGAVGDDRSGGFRLGQPLVDAFCQREQLFESMFAGTDVGDFQRAELGDRFSARADRRSVSSGVTFGPSLYSIILSRLSARLWIVPPVVKQPDLRQIGGAGIHADRHCARCALQ